MSEREQDVVTKLADVAKHTGGEKLEYITGYIDGMAAMVTVKAEVIPPEKKEGKDDAERES